MTIMVMEKGDEALKKVSLAINNTLLSHREDDLFARYGGEEFVVLIKDISLDELNKIANNILDSIKKLKIKHDYSSANEYLTVSIGIANFDGNKDIPKIELLIKSDETLYKVKASGRNNFLITNL